MRYLSKIQKCSYGLSTIGLAAILITVCFGAVWFFSRSGEVTGLIMALVAVITIAIAVASLIFPLFGFYVCIISTYFIFDAMRFLRTDAPLVSGIDAMVYIVFIGVMIEKISKKESFWKNCKNPVVFMYVLIIFYYIMEYFNPNSVSREIYFLMFRRFATILLFFYCALQLFNTYARIRQFFIIIISLSLIAAVYGVYEKWVGMPKYELDYFMSDEGVALGMLDNGEFRIASFLSDCTAFGLLMSGSLIIVLSIALNHKTSSTKRIILIFSIIMMAFAMSYSGTRTATVMLVVEVILYILMTSTQRKTIVFSIFFALLLGAVLFTPSYGNGTLNRLKSTFETDDESLKVRDENRKYIQPYILSHPIGGGVGTTGVVYAKYNTGHPLAGFPTDSGLLAMVLEFGWIGLILQCATYFITLLQGIRGYYRSRNSRHRLLYLAATLCIFGYVVAQYSQIAIGQIPGGFIFYGLTAAIIMLHQTDSADK